MRIAGEEQRNRCSVLVGGSQSLDHGNDSVGRVVDFGLGEQGAEAEAQSGVESFGGDAHADGQGDRLRAGTLAALLMAAPDPWPQLDATADQQEADSFGTMKLVSAAAERRDA